jgi:precorrin-6B methylase 2
VKIFPTSISRPSRTDAELRGRLRALCVGARPPRRLQSKGCFPTQLNPALLVMAVNEAEYQRLLAVGASYVKNLRQAADANCTLRQFVAARAQYEELQSLSESLTIDLSMQQHIAAQLARPELMLAGLARRAATAGNRTEWVYEDRDALLNDEQDAPWRSSGRDKRSICPLVRSPSEVLDGALDLARCGQGDVLCDIGCGDGRMLLAAARRGSRAVGFDVNSSCLERSRAAALHEGMMSLIEVIEQDILELAGHPRFEAATIVYVYLQPKCIEQLTPLLSAAVAAGKRVIIYCTTGALTSCAAGNALGDLKPARITMGGMLRLYESG